MGASGAHFLITVSQRHVRRLAMRTNGSTSVSVISLEETRCPWLSSTTTDKSPVIARPFPVAASAGMISVQPSALLASLRPASGLAPAYRPARSVDRIPCTTADLQFQRHCFAWLKIPRRRRQITPLSVLRCRYSTSRQIISLRVVIAATT